MYSTGGVILGPVALFFLSLRQFLVQWVSRKSAVSHIASNIPLTSEVTCIYVTDICQPACCKTSQHHRCDSKAH